VRFMHRSRGAENRHIIESCQRKLESGHGVLGADHKYCSVFPRPCFFIYFWASSFVDVCFSFCISLSSCFLALS